MAVTQTKKPEELTQTPYQPQQAQYPQQGYQGLAGVSENTAKQAGQYQQGYQPGAATTAAQQQLQSIQQQKPQGYTSRFGGQLDDIMQKLQNPGKFKYNFNDDEAFKYYADIYTQNAKQASANAAGQAAALTGGYGNSYAQQAASQAYQQNLIPLYERAMDLYDRAYQQHRDERGDLKDTYGILSAQDEKEYGRYRDEVGDWQGERDYWTGREDTLSGRDREAFENDRDYWTGLARIENADYRTEQERQEAIRQYEQDYARRTYESDRDFDESQRRYDTDDAYRRDAFNWQKETDQRDYDRAVLESDRKFEEEKRQFDAQLQENVRQFDASLDWDKMSTQQKYAAEYAMSILANGQIPSEELLKQAGLSAADAQKMMAKIAAGGGGTRSTPAAQQTPQRQMGMDEAGKWILQNTPDNVKPYNSDRTIGEYKAAIQPYAQSLDQRKKEAAQKALGATPGSNGSLAAGAVGSVPTYSENVKKLLGLSK